MIHSSPSLRSTPPDLCESLRKRPQPGNHSSLWRISLILLLMTLLPGGLADRAAAQDSLPPVGIPGDQSAAAQTPAAGVDSEDAASSGEPRLTVDAPFNGQTFSTRVLEMVQSLSYFSIPFALATLIAIWFIVERIVVLRRGRVVPKPFVQRFIKLIEEGELTREEALQICEDNGSPIALVFAHGIRKWGKASVEVEQAMIDGGERQVAALSKHLRIINGVATITPLLGLLGTVWGMLESFNKIASAGAMGRTEELASGIALALVTTACGLLIAIPCLVVYMYLTSRIDSLVSEMDDLAMKVVYNISAEGIAERNSRPNKSKNAGDAGQKKTG